eukprot:9718247-Heterocapsa_arctica.AAC.1
MRTTVSRPKGIVLPLMCEYAFGLQELKGYRSPFIGPGRCDANPPSPGLASLRCSAPGGC